MSQCQQWFNIKTNIPYLPLSSFQIHFMEMYSVISSQATKKKTIMLHYIANYLWMCLNIAQSNHNADFWDWGWGKVAVQLSSVQSLSRVQLFATPWIEHARPPCPSPTPRVHPNPCPSSRWCHPAISSSVVPFSSCPQSLPESGSFPMSQLFTSGGQSIGVSASASVLPVNTQGWSPLGWTGWTSLQSKGLSRVFYNTTVQKHQFFGTQLSL